MYFTVKQKIMAFGKQYRAFDDAGNQVYEIRSMILTPERRKEVFDMGGNLVAWSEWPVMSGQAVMECADTRVSFEVPFMSLAPEWTGTDGSGNSFAVTGDFFRRSFTVSVAGSQVATIYKRFLSFADAYEVNVSEGFRPEFALLVVAVIDHKYHSDNN
jgi:uncharacterized protein YxjI